MFCSKCGFQNNQGEIFCIQCGAKLENSNQQVQQQNQFIQSQQDLNNNMQMQQQNQFIQSQQDLNNNMQMQQQNQFIQSQQGPNNNMQMNNLYNQQNVNTNTQNSNSGIYKLTLTRPNNFVGSLIKFKIFIDNNNVGTIKNGETIVLNVGSGNHVISFNKTMDQNINITSDTYADVVVIAGNKFGLSNIRDNNGLTSQNNELNVENADKIIKSAKGPLILSCACIAITFILLFTAEKVVSPWVYGISIGYTIINLSSIKKYKQFLNNKYSSLLTLDIISIIISVIGFIISGFLIIG